MLLVNVALLGLGLLDPSGPTGGKIAWEPTFAGAMERARTEKRILFVSTGHVGEARTKHFVEKLYTDRRVASVAERTLNLTGVEGLHRAKGACPKFEGITCEQHRFIDAALGEQVFPANEGGVIPRPQHAWLDSEGKVLLSVPWEMSAEELLWCFEKAQQLTGEDVEFSAGGRRPPRRLVLGAAYRLPAELGLGRGLTPIELEAEIDQTKSNVLGAARIESWTRILFTDHKDAVEFAERQLGGGLASWGGTATLVRTLHAIGAISPASFCGVLEAHVKSKEPILRSEVAVAFEQIGNPRMLKTVQGALSREKEASVRKNWYRALGACGGEDKKARKTLLQATSNESNESARRNAIVALGYLAHHADVSARMRELLRSPDASDRAASACAMALSRQAEFTPDLEAVLESEDAPGEEPGPVGEERGAMEAALAVLRGANLITIRAAVREVARDTIERERVFFSSGGQ